MSAPCLTRLIDLVDDAGARQRLSPIAEREPVIEFLHIEDIVARMARISPHERLEMQGVAGNEKCINLPLIFIILKLSKRI